MGRTPPGPANRRKKVTTDCNRINDFKEFAGDKPLNKYVFTDFQAWSDLLVRVPQNHVKLPAIREKSRQEAADYNDALPIKKRLPTLSEENDRQQLSESASHILPRDGSRASV